MSDVAPPFVGFIELSQMSETTRDELLGKMLSGEHPAYVYSSEADGRLEPARITPAEFFKAWRRAQQEAGCDDCLDASGWPLKKMGPFQIRVPDRDIRRDRHRLMRRTIAVPHWIYVLKADLDVGHRTEAAIERNGSGNRMATHATAEEACGAWIRSLPQEPRPKKGELEKVALAKYQGLSDLAFGRQWALHAPASWKRRGRF